MKSHSLETKLKKDGFFSIAGIDETGRGPWAGPLVTAAVILKPNLRLPGLNDSKKLTPGKRQQLFKKILSKAYVGIGIITNYEIDNKGLGVSLKNGFKSAIKNLPVNPDYILIDGIGKYDFKIPYKTVKFGDSKIRSIAAASVVAKVVRDMIMDINSVKYPKYGFSGHKGYGTRQHHKNLLKYGVCELHRKSFAPVKEILNDTKKT